MNKKKYLVSIVFGIVLLTLIIIIPQIMNGYIMTVVNTMLIYYIAALSITIIFGMAGQLAISAGAFMGLGGFITAQLALNYGVNTVLAIFESLVLVSIISFFIGFALMRLKGVFFCFATIALMQLASSVFNNFRRLTGGPDGIYGIPKLVIFGFEFNNLTKWFYLLCGIGLICGLIVKRMQSTSIGRGFAYVRDNHVAANTLGINVYLTRVLAFVVSSAFASLAGSLLAYHNGTINPSLFTITTTTNFLLMSIIGGVNSTVGTFLGTALVTMMPEWLRPLREYLILINGVLIIVLMVFMPSGIIGILSKIKIKIINLFNRDKNNKRQDQENEIAIKSKERL